MEDKKHFQNNLDFGPNFNYPIEPSASNHESEQGNNIQETYKPKSLNSDIVKLDLEFS